VRLDARDRSVGYVRLGAEDFAGVDVEPAADFSERFQVRQVAALDAAEGGGAGPDFFGDLTDASIPSFFNDFSGQWRQGLIAAW